MTAPIKPMQAHDVGAAKFESPFENAGWVAQQKLDGFRCQLHLHADGPNEAWSRTAHDMIDGVPFLRDLKVSQDVILDGELIAENGGSSHDVNHFLAARSGLVYAAFDVLMTLGVRTTEFPLSARMNALLDVGVFSGKLFALPYESVDKRGLFDRVVLQGGEGIVLKDLTAPYQPGKRSWSWLKVKKTDTYDVVIVDCDSKPSQWTVRPGCRGTDGVLYHEGKLTHPWLAGFVGLSYGLYDPVVMEFRRIGSIGVTGPKEEMMGYVGKVVEVKGWGRYAKTGAIRHPQMIRIREPWEKSPEECVFPGQ